MRRRKYLGYLTSGSVVALAGCGGDGGGDGGGGGDGSDGGGDGGDGGTATESGSDGGGGTLEFTMGTNTIPAQMDLPDPCARADLEFQRLLEDQLGDSVNINYVPESQLCSEETCVDKVEANAVQMGNASMGNSTANFAANAIWALPYLWPTGPNTGRLDPYPAQAHTLTHPKSWEDYWVPFAKEHGVIPALISTPPRTRQIFVGTASTDKYGLIRTPADAKGLKYRRTQSRVSARSVETWGMNPQAVSWSDTLQGLRTGVIDGYEAFDNDIFCFGQFEVTGSITFNHWSMGNGIFWTNVEWLKSLSDAQRQAVADASREAYKKVVRITPRIEREQVGVPEEPGQDPPEGTLLAENDITPVILNEEEINAWRDPVSPKQNRDMWSDIFEDVEAIGVDSEDMFNHIWDTARSSSVPALEDFEPEAWWDDYFDQI